MRPKWQLDVEKFGRIGQAEVEVRPLLLLVGANNTGKSYLASLLWGLIAMQSELSPLAGSAIEACIELLRRTIPEGSHQGNHDLTQEETALFDRLVEAGLDAGRDRLVRRIFNSDAITAGRIALHNTSPARYPKLSWTRHDKTTEVCTMDGRLADVKLSVPGDLVYGPDGVAVTAATIVLGGQLSIVSPMGSNRRFNDAFSKGDPVFLPASRTGFMQLYKAAARRSMKQAFRKDHEDALGDQQWLNLTTPAFHFIDMLAFGLPESRETRFAEEAQLLEQAIQGKIQRSAERGLNDYRYYASDMAEPLSMNLASSLVTEIAPIVLVLRHLDQFPVLILEEPEAHLHPALQRRLAQVVVRLIRKGVYVWITTHSENFCQQINNFIKMGMSPDREALQAELGYGSQDYLELEDVAGYGFQLEGDQTTVTRLDASEEGLTMPTFNEELIALSKETLLLQRRTTGQR